MNKRTLIPVLNGLVVILIILTIFSLSARSNYSNIINSKEQDDSRTKTLYFADTINTESNTIFEINVSNSLIGDTIAFNSYYSRIDVSVIDSNGNEVYSIINNDDKLIKRMGRHIYSFKVTDEFRDCKIRFGIRGVLNRVHYPVLKVIAGDNMEIVSYYFSKQLWASLATIIMLVYSSLMFITAISIFRGNKDINELINISLFGLTLSIWSIASLDVVEYLCQNTIVYNYLGYFALYTAPVYMLKHIRIRTDSDTLKKSTVSEIIIIHNIIIATLIVLDFIGINFRQSIVAYNVLLVIETSFISKYLYKNIIKQSNKKQDKIKALIELITLIIAIVYGVTDFNLKSHVCVVFIDIAIIVYITRLYIESIQVLKSSIILGKQSEELKKLAYIDELTKIGNRNAFIAKLGNIEKSNLTLIAFDVNNLKFYNDNYGHDKGDQLLINMAMILKKTFGDNAYRLGGDEFEVIIEDSNINIEEKLKEFEINEQEMNKKSKSGVIVNAAYGYCSFNKGYDVHDLIKLADTQMYINKRRMKEKIAK